MSQTQPFGSPEQLIGDVRSLAWNIEAGQHILFRWKTQSRPIIEGNYRAQLRNFSSKINAQATPYKEAVELGIKQARRGSGVAHHIFHLLDQLITGTTPQEAVDLLEGVRDKTRVLCETTKNLRDNFYTADEESLPKLKAEMMNDQIMAEPDNVYKQSNFFGYYFAIGIGLVQALLGVPPVNCYAYDADFYKRPIDILEKHVDFWIKFLDIIANALQDQRRLLNQKAILSTTRVRKQKASWSELERQFDSYSSLALTSKQILEIIPSRPSRVSQ
ncbi:hypothetical protein FRB96_003039 [Tulasnella sp. 330]|nr:hypothetical protein FRB96_003039 [Tulasnella sp. 330]